MAKKKTTTQKKQKPSPTEKPFEQSFDQLKQIVIEMENGNLTLTESLEKYQDGIARLRDCHAALEAAKKRIEVLVDLDDDGNLITRSFDSTSSATATDGVRRSTDMRSSSQTSRNDASSEIDDYEPDVDEDEDEGGLF